MREYFIVLVVIFLSACSSVSIPVESAKEATLKFNVDQFQASETNTQEVVVISDNHFGPSIIKTQIHINGVKIASLNQGEKVTFFVKPGLYQFGWSALTEGNYREQEFTVGKELKNVFHLVSPAGDVLRYIREK